MDDEGLILKNVRTILEKSGYEVRTVSGGQQALVIYRQMSFDAVILDLTIPSGMGGKKSIKELIKIDPKVRVIVSSGYSNEEVMGNFREMSFCTVLPKPCLRR